MNRLGTSLYRLLLAVGVLTLLLRDRLLLTNYGPATALTYLVDLFPAFGLVAVWQVLWRAERREDIALTLARVAAHWLGPLIALRLLFLQLHRGSDGRGCRRRDGDRGLHLAYRDRRAACRGCGDWRCHALATCDGGAFPIERHTRAVSTRTSDDKMKTL